MLDEGVLGITDFRMAGFLVSRGVPFLRTLPPTNSRGEVIFCFDNSANKALDVMNLYPNSAEQRYDAACRTMHDMVRMVSKQSK